MVFQLAEFVRESNFIEGIRRDPLPHEIVAHERFLSAQEVTIGLLQDFVRSVQPDAILRNYVGLDVMVGAYRPPPGGAVIISELSSILAAVKKWAPEPDIFWLHHRYENLHPFTDGNGRSGRALWLWMMGGETQRPFLHEWYYQSLRIELNSVRRHANLLR